MYKKKIENLHVKLEYMYMCVCMCCMYMVVTNIFRQLVLQVYIRPRSPGCVCYGFGWLMYRYVAFKMVMWCGS